MIKSGSKIFAGMGVYFSVLCLFALSRLEAQEKGQYIVGESGQLEMIVHIIGEVKRPGEYRVVDSTNLMELISKAEGPTEFSNLGGVAITRIEHDLQANAVDGNGRVKRINKIIKYNVSDYLKKTTTAPPPVLKPGDVVLVPRNNWHRWRNAFTVIRDLSVIVTTYWIITRIENN
jgi:hypothetical protein